MDFELLRALQVVLGIGLVIFVHELGHYIAARLCKVRVEVFSLGFGPKLLAWRRGPTLYQIAALPLGGFCRMAGEENRWQGREPLPDELPAKSVEARFFIYSAGVLMNVLFVLVVFPILFTVGVPFVEPRIGGVDPGGPAWRANVPVGAEVLSIGGEDVFEFSQLQTEVALAGGDPVELVVRRPGDGAVETFVLQPVKHEDLGLATIGVRPAIVRDEGGLPVLDVAAGSPAHQAGLRTGDRLVRVLDADPELSVEEQLEIRLPENAPLRLLVRGPAGERTVEVVPTLTDAGGRRVGITPPRNLVVGLREGSLPAALGLQEGDRLVEVAGTPILRKGDLLRALRAAEEPLTVIVRREGRRRVLTGPAPAAEQRAAFLDGLAVELDLENNWVVVQPGEAAARAGLADGDRVLDVDGSTTASWRDVYELVRDASSADRPMVFRVERTSAPEAPPTYATITVAANAVPLADYGLSFQRAQYVYRAENTLAAIRFGFYSSWKVLEELWFALEGLVSGSLSARDNLGGPITIATLSYTIADSGWPRFFFFLCFISMNLAVLNVLPIPVLDGGHLFFLLIEKIKGSPVSDRVLGYSQMVGVVVILALMVFVTYNDIVRLFEGS